MSQTTTRRDKLKAAHDKLVEAVSSIVSGEDWQRMLKVASKFHHYSFNNQLLIYLQRPEATYVAGFRRWADLNRWVRKGERGIAILAPVRYKRTVEDEHGEEQNVNVLKGFRVTHVFDISQTDGEPLADLDAVKPQLLDGAAPDGLWDALVVQCSDVGYDVVREQRGSANGYCDFGAKHIGVRPDVSDAQAVKTLVHELAHAMLHNDDVPRPRTIQETEVESVAYIVLNSLGLASDDYSFPYVARWSDGDVGVLKDTAARVTTCATRILAGLTLPGEG